MFQYGEGRPRSRANFSGKLETTHSASMNNSTGSESQGVSDSAKKKLAERLASSYGAIATDTVVVAKSRLLFRTWNNFNQKVFQSRRRWIGFEAQDIDLINLCEQKYPGKRWSELPLPQQVDIIRDGLKKRTWMINPNNLYMKYWDACMVVLLGFTAVATPFEVAFVDFVDHFSVFSIVNRIIDAFFIKDLIMNFFLKSVERVESPRATRIRYLKTWFFPDMVSAIPVDVILLAVGRGQKLQLVRILRLLKALKMFRILRSSRTLSRWQTYWAINFATQKLFKFTIALILVSHWMACAWGFMGRVHAVSLCNGSVQVIFKDSDLPIDEKSWITNLFLVTKPNTPDDPCNNLHIYTVALHFAVMTITSIGYGDVSPIRNSEYLLCIVCMLMGGLLWAYLIGSVCGIIANTDPVQVMFESNTDVLNVMMDDARVDNFRRQTFREFLREAKAIDNIYHFRGVAEKFSPMLRGELLMHVSSRWACSIPYMKKAPMGFVMDLCEAVQPSFYSKAESCTTLWRNLCINEKGTIVCGGHIKQPGNAWNIDFIVAKPRLRRPQHVMALTYCLISQLSPANFFAKIVKYPDFERIVKRTRLRFAFAACLLFCSEIVRSAAIEEDDKPSLHDVFNCIDLEHSTAEDLLIVEGSQQSDQKKLRPPHDLTKPSDVSRSKEAFTRSEAFVASWNRRTVPETTRSNGQSPRPALNKFQPPSSTPSSVGCEFRQRSSSPKSAGHESTGGSVSDGLREAGTCPDAQSTQNKPTEAKLEEMLAILHKKVREVQMQLQEHRQGTCNDDRNFVWM